jgi:hypothetical protein
LPSKRIGRTAASWSTIILPANGCQFASTAVPNTRRAVDTAPAGRMIRQPPAPSSARAARRERALAATASRVPAKLIGRMCARTSGTRQSVLIATILKSGRTVEIR